MIFNTQTLNETIDDKVKEIILHSMKSVCGKINKLERKICFEKAIGR